MVSVSTQCIGSLSPARPSPAASFPRPPMHRHGLLHLLTILSRPTLAAEVFFNFSHSRLHRPRVCLCLSSAKPIAFLLSQNPDSTARAVSSPCTCRSFTVAVARRGQAAVTRPPCPLHLPLSPSPRRSHRPLGRDGIRCGPCSPDMARFAAACRCTDATMAQWQAQARRI